ncbi:MAG: hypothetical protein AAF335_03245 [Bacteroidota bacterium]
MNYPLEHRQLVKELLSGKFIDTDSPFYKVLRAKKTFYSDFFEHTFNYHLEGHGEFYYLTSTETSENSSRDFLLFLSLLCYEYQNRGKDIVHKISEGTFLVKEVSQYIERSAKKDLLDNTQVMDRDGQLNVKRFLDIWERRNLVVYINKKIALEEGTPVTKFQFKEGINLFLHVAFALYEDYLEEKRAEGS